ncbi:TetR/AcrR family transcriptional regulator, partial [Bacillus sp. S34]|nr:TetR/AcrR family transcriptional regulator [Bacillus sp. S34]
RLETQARPIIDRAETAGVVRAGFDYRDLPMLTSMVGAVADSTRAHDPNAWRRYAEVLIEGVLPGGTEAPM